ncbi:DUF1707 SHOCT-like domain-containing protein [Nocardia macrotermitis]|uniref:DUF1707 domain-containing protein n=1 Tax=Nocardia macrotermitis TaxID=2585198 RepID=A0A7K0CYC3_9NOCA|nr:DUF1707 domain-containing protein [Nocardia macrotermitis]MQY18485.1 hypothetical protein [Nocardia macrotermitis]
MDITSGTRADDVERQQIADLLARHLGAGRIDLTEYDQRVARVWNCATRDDLQLVLADLPKLVAERPANAVHQGPRIPLWQRIEGAAWLGVSVLCVVIWALISLGMGQFTYPWPMWVIGPWGAVLAFRALTGWEARGCRGRGLAR